MISEFSKKMRIGLVCTAAWIILFFVMALEEGRDYRRGFDFADFFGMFFGLGILPALIVWGIVWIRSAPAQEKK